MERPSRSKGRTTSTKKGPPILRNNPISAWFANRKNMKLQAKEDAAREISNNKAENERKICAVLDGINFGSSPLPVEVLDKKTDPNQPYGDIEYDIFVASQMIRNNTQDYSGLDISAIDSGIYQIANFANHAVVEGNVHTVKAACRGLLVMIGHVRDMIPTIPVDLQKGFLKSAEEYVNLWILYITNNTALDRLERNAQARKAFIDSRSADLEATADKLADRLINDEEFGKQYVMIKNQSYLKDGENWTPDMLEMFKQLVDRRIEESSLRFEMLHYNIDVMKLEAQKGILEHIWTTLRSVPVANDPDLMNKYNDIINKSFEEAARVDQEFDEFINVINQMDAKIDQLANSPGSIAMRNIVSDEIDQLVEKAKQKQLEAQGLAEQTDTYGSGLGLYTEQDVNTNRTRPRNMN